MVSDIFRTLIARRVNAAMSQKFHCPLTYPDSGLRFTDKERQLALTSLFGEICQAMGMERFAETPVERLDQFAVMSVRQNHEAGELLRSLVDSFMAAYSNPDTTERAFAVLLQMKLLGAEQTKSTSQQSICQVSSVTEEHKDLIQQ